MSHRSCSVVLLAAAALLVSSPARAKAGTTLVVSVPDQKLAVLQDGLRAGIYPVSTSRFGIGDRQRSYATPLGMLKVVAKIGQNALEGTVFHGRRPTGEVLRPNAKGRDPIVTRILRLSGMESMNANAFGRGIYIHGTPQERLIGRPASYGCIRMRSRDVVKVFDAAPVGTTVQIVNQRLSHALQETATVRQTSGGAS